LVCLKSSNYWRNSNSSISKLHLKGSLSHV
jgi:hypothetical protein